MRYSLATLILVVLWIGSAMAVWTLREPWRKVGEFAVTSPQEFVPCVTAPDGRRLSVPGRARLGLDRVSIAAPGDDGELLWLSPTLPRESRHCARFEGDDTLVVLSFDNPDRIDTASEWSRRFPEYWWGHCCRPEVYVFLAFTAALLLKARARWRSVKNSLPAPPPQGPP